MMVRKRREMADMESQITPQIDSLLLIDRSVDLITPLLTQLTYEGLIDEIFGIENSEYFADIFNFRKLLWPVNENGGEAYNVRLPCYAAFGPRKKM